MHDGLAQGARSLLQPSLAVRGFSRAGDTVPGVGHGTGSNWQCNKAAFVITTCTQVH